MRWDISILGGIYEFNPPLRCRLPLRPPLLHWRLLLTVSSCTPPSLSEILKQKKWKGEGSMRSEGDEGKERFFLQVFCIRIHGVRVWDTRRV